MNVSHNSTNATVNLRALFMTVAVENLVLNLPLNLYTMWLVLRGSREKLAADFIALNQFVCEILLVLYSLILPMGLDLRGPAGHILAFFNSMFWCGRTIFQAAVCMEQYLAVIHPFVFLRCKPLRYRAAFCCASWVLIITISATLSHFLSTTPMVFNTMVVLHALMMATVLFCGIMALLALRRPPPGDRGKGRSAGTMGKAFNMVLGYLLYIIFLHSPVVTILFCFHFRADRILCIFAYATFMLYISTGFVSPVLYLYKHGRLPATCSCC